MRAGSVPRAALEPVEAPDAAALVTLPRGRAGNALVGDDDLGRPRGRLAGTLPRPARAVPRLSAHAPRRTSITCTTGPVGAPVGEPPRGSTEIASLCAASTAVR